LRVRDDGRGFIADHVVPAQLGLSIMRERAAIIGATLLIESRLDQGTEIVVVWPGGPEAAPLAKLPQRLAEPA
jgi:signal transduction histidine kinase